MGGMGFLKLISQAFPRLISSLPSFFSALSLALFFARAPLSERLERASDDSEIELESIKPWSPTQLRGTFNSRLDCAPRISESCCDSDKQTDPGVMCMRTLHVEVVLASTSLRL